MRVVLDTNVVVAGIAYPAGPPGRIVAAWRNGVVDVAVSPWTLAECERVLPRLRPTAALSQEEISELLSHLAFNADVVKPDLAALAEAAQAGVRDAADEPVLAALLASFFASRADVLITSDKDLLSLAGQFSIATPAEFCARHAL